MTDQRLGRNDRLKKRKVIQTLFKSGNHSKGYPIRILWTVVERDGPRPIRAAFSVPKRKIRRATDRNLIKRRMREAYRKNRHLVDLSHLSANTQLVAMCIYVPNEIVNYTDIERGMCKALTRISIQSG